MRAGLSVVALYLYGREINAEDYTGRRIVAWCVGHAHDSEVRRSKSLQVTLPQNGEMVNHVPRGNIGKRPDAETIAAGDTGSLPGVRGKV